MIVHREVDQRPMRRERLPHAFRPSHHVFFDLLVQSCCVPKVQHRCVVIPSLASQHAASENQASHTARVPPFAMSVLGLTSRALRRVWGVAWWHRATESSSFLQSSLITHAAPHQTRRITRARTASSTGRSTNESQRSSRTCRSGTEKRHLRWRTEA